MAGRLNRGLPFLFMSAWKPPFDKKDCMRIFWKKKEKEPVKKKMDFSGYDMKLTIKSICMFERMSGKSFFRMSDDDMMMLLYCTFFTSNNVEINYGAFVRLLEVEEIAKWAISKYTDLLDVIKQFQSNAEVVDEPVSGTEENKLTVTDLATSLIVDYHLDAHYVMYEMDLWEIEPMYRACDTNVKRRYEEERLWTYIGVMPHIDGKKIKGPGDLIPFPWEDKKGKAMEELNKNTAAAVAFLGGNSDEGGHDN